MKKSHFEDIPGCTKQRNHPGHNAPMYIHIPAGKVYIHVCPSCGKETRVYGNIITLSK